MAVDWRCRLGGFSKCRIFRMCVMSEVGKKSVVVDIGEDVLEVRGVLLQKMYG